MKALYDFDVRTEPLETESGIKTDRLAVIREDNNNVLGIVSDTYKFIPHKEVVDQVEDSIQDIDFGEKVKWERSKVRMSGGGARLYVDFVAPKYEVVIGSLKDGGRDLVNPSLTLTNSYDGSLKVGFLIGASRLVCTNGLRIGVTLFDIYRRHTSGLDVHEIFRNLGTYVFDTFNGAVENYKAMNNNVIQDVPVYIESLIKDKGVPKKLANKMGESIHSGDTSWYAYNVFTRYLTHDYNKTEDRREELQSIVANAFGIGGN